MNNSESDSREKVLQLFRELVGELADRLRGNVHNAESTEAARIALSEELKEQPANDIAFHLTDWNSDAAFIVALHVFPERFTPAEIRDGVERFLMHAPNHIAAAAKLSGYPVADIFGIDALSEARHSPGA